MLRFILAQIHFFYLCLSCNAQAYTINLIQNTDFSWFKEGSAQELDSNLIFQVSDLNGNGYFFDNGIDGMCIIDNILKSKSVASFNENMIFSYKDKLYSIGVKPPQLMVCLAEHSALPVISLQDTLPTFNIFDFNSAKLMSLNRAICKQYDFVYISVWASYCSPCLEEMPYFSEFQKIYKKKILFIHLCLSDDESNAKKVINNLNPPGIQASCSKAELRLINADLGFPRGNLYDSNGQLVQAFYHAGDMFNFLTNGKL